jgi:predicted RND superfamily exporter protein
VRDLRQYARQTEHRLIAGGLILLVLVGDGLILLLYGTGPAILGLLCIFVGLVPVLMVFGVMLFLDWISKHTDDS